MVADSRKSFISLGIARPRPARHSPARFSRRQAIARPPTRTTPPTPVARKPAAKRKTPIPAELAPKAPGTPRKKAAIAGPKTPRAARKPAAKSPDLLEMMQAVITASLEDDKAEHIVALDLAGRASFADRMVIATGIADRQIAAMATHLITKLAEIGVKRVRVEGANGADWVLVDAGDIVIHLFKPDARNMYALEKMWGADLDDPAPSPGPIPAPTPANEP